MAYQKYYVEVGFGEEADFLRSANLIITVIQQIHGAAGGKPPKLNLDDIYPQLGEPKKNKRKKSANALVDWDRTPDRLKKEFIAAGLFDEEGNPKGYNPHK